MSDRHRDLPMPRGLHERALAWLGDPDTEVAPARLSASVLLVRPGADTGVEVFVQHRSPTMPFAPGVLAFPGGGVDPRDAEVVPSWAGPSPQEWGARLGLPTAGARTLVLAAARELFEECGVLLAGPVEGVGTAGAGVQPTHRDAQDRADLVARRRSFAELLTERSLTLRSDRLTLVGHWVTPAFEPRRYDTYFFAAQVPPGQQADGRTGEAVRARWVTPERALAEHASGQEVLLPPTQVLLEQWRDPVADVGALLAGWPEVSRVQPWPVQEGGVLSLRLPLSSGGS